MLAFSIWLPLEFDCCVVSEDNEADGSARVTHDNIVSNTKARICIARLLLRTSFRRTCSKVSATIFRSIFPASANDRRVKNDQIATSDEVWSLSATNLADNAGLKNH